MPATARSGGGERRRHDAQASRAALLDAATELFDERGYEATTVREIGERAAVDPALIARYFGGKEGLYLATFERAGRPELPADAHELVHRILQRSETRGLGPVARAAVSPTLTDAMREQVRAILAARTVGPLAEAFERNGTPAAQVRAELVVATALGVSLIRAGGTLPALQAATIDELAELLAPVIDALASPGA